MSCGIKKLNIRIRRFAEDATIATVYFILKVNLDSTSSWKGFRPEFKCAEVNITELLPFDDHFPFDDRYLITYDKCDIHVYTNDTNKTELMSTGCLAGYSYPVDKHFSIVTEWDLVCNKAGLVEVSQTLYVVGMAIGSFVGTQLADRFGRKPVFLAGSITLFTLSIILMFIQDIVTFIVFRLLMGMSFQMVLVGYVAIVEMVPMEIRMRVEIYGMTLWTSGFCLLGLLAYLFRNTSWRYLELALALASAHVLLIPWFLEESVRWLLANGRYIEAHRIIRKAARWNNKNYEDVIRLVKEKTTTQDMLLSKTTINGEIGETGQHVRRNTKIQMSEEQTMKKQSEISETNQKNECPHIDPSEMKHFQNLGVQRYTLCTIFKDRRIFLNASMLGFLWITCSLVYYTLTLTSAALDGNRFVNFILLSLVEFPGIILEACLLNRIGRAKLLIILYSSCSVFLLLATLLSLYRDVIEGFSIASRVATFLGKMDIASSFSVIWLYTAEMYPTNLRSVGSGISTVCGKVGFIMAPYAGLLADIIPWGPGVICSAFGFVSATFVCFLPETLGHELPTSIEELKLWHRRKLGKKSTKDAVK